MTEQVESETPSVKDLASSESSVRRAALKTITTHIADRSCTSPFTATQCLQLWRGLYVALYMHDSKNAISVQNLTKELAGTVPNISAKDDELNEAGGTAGAWLDGWTAAFWETVCREWASIDQWRMNKVLLLVRFFLREVFNVVLSEAISDESPSKAASEALTARQVQVFEACALNPKSLKVPDGLRLHVLDIWSDELSGQVQAHQGENEADLPVAVDAARSLMAPVHEISKKALSKGVRTRAKEAIASFEESFPQS